MKSVVITGGTRGIKHGLALEFLKKGYKTIISGTSESTISDAKSYFHRLGFSNHITIYHCNISNPDELSDL